MDFSANLSLPYLLPNQAQKHVTVNKTLSLLDAVLQLSVLSRTQVNPPETPQEGERYIPASGSTAAWEGANGQIVCFQDGSWQTYPPRAGWQAWIEDESRRLIFDGAEWVDPDATLETGTLGINSTADETNRLTLKSPATLLDHEGANHQLKVNKASDMDTASLVFQSEYSGHAEIGLVGNTDFSLKVSEDGQSFTSALMARASDGFIGLGTDAPISRLHIQEPDTLITLESTQSNAGAALDLRNLADDQSWRITGTKTVLKIRDHTANLNKLVLKSGPDGEVLLKNCGNIGIATSSPTASLHVDGSLRIGSEMLSTLPSASMLGEGSLIYVSDATGGGVMAYSDGTDWRRVSDNSLID